MEKTLNHAGITAADELFDEIITGRESDAEMETLASEVARCVNMSKDGRDGPIAWRWSNWGGVEFVELV